MNLFEREALLKWAAENLNGWAIIEMIDKGEELGWTDAHTRKGADTWAGLVDRAVSRTDGVETSVLRSDGLQQEKDNVARRGRPRSNEKDSAS